MIPKEMLPDPLFLEEIGDLSTPRVGLAVLGRPIGHSISPILHHAALSVLSKEDASFDLWQYDRIDLEPSLLPEALKKLSLAGYIGLNLTIPHKVEVLKVLNDIDPEAQLMGAVNTLHFGSGSWVGHNTDGIGLSRAISTDLGIRFQDECILIIGAGGAARAASVQCLLEGCEFVHILNRSKERLNGLVEPLAERFGRNRIKGSSLEDLKISDFKDKKWLVINATSVGLSEEDPSSLPFSCSLLSPESAVYDMIYNPTTTTLLKDAAKAGLDYSNGLSMLIFQAAKALEIWTQKEIPADIMFDAACKHFQ